MSKGDTGFRSVPPSFCCRLLPVKVMVAAFSTNTTSSPPGSPDLLIFQCYWF
ncbi:Hypothetical predicted protein [Marmota monax]|uniref:Uncharacterized protein n=1 Tax=Marmota monax TaxID=9995 RepID=A0A5E4CJI7_MARMO|nr:hypothetical protein GHT09_010034 [Marmota monax]VTJ82023.1 Hypothetical predicted protein [Marmota monax]